MDNRPTIGWIILFYLIACLAIVLPLLWIPAVVMIWMHIRRMRRNRRRAQDAIAFPLMAAEVERG